MQGLPHDARSVFVTDGEQRAALAVVRSLGAAGWRCIVGSVSGRSLTGASRYAYEEVVLPDPVANAAAYGERVIQEVERRGIDLVLPISEPSVLSILAMRNLTKAAIPFPALESFEAISDKQQLLDSAQSLGIRVPRQYIVNAPSEPVVGALNPPFVVKPHRSVCSGEDGTRVKLTVSWAHTTDELRHRIAEYPPAAFPILVQEAVTGQGVGLFLLLDDQQQVIARFSHRRIREKPPTGGVSVLRRSEPMNEALFEKSVALLRHYCWSGVAMVEYKLDDRSGEPFLMEVNGRLWGSLQLAIDAGIDFPRRMAEPGSTPQLHQLAEYSLARSRWFWGDVDHLTMVWRDPRNGWRDRIRTTAGWLLAFGPGYREEVFRWSDPRPFMRESADWVQQVLR